MLKLLLVGLLGAATSPLLAQVAPVPAPIAPQMARPMMAQTTTRAEVQARAQTRFARRDVNRDGFLTAEEMTMRGRGQGRMAMRQRGAMRDPNVAFERLDANRDNMISRAEFGQARQMRMQRRVVVNQRGGGAGDQRRMGAGMRRGGGGGGGGMMLRMADANRDGRVSLAEATSGALRRFDMIDVNRDGRITPQERAAGRAQMRQMRQAG